MGWGQSDRLTMRPSEPRELSRLRGLAVTPCVGNLGVRQLKRFAKGNRVKLYPDDWRVRLTGSGGALLAGAIALFVVKPMIELPAWLGALAFVGMMTVGVVLGNIVGWRLFKPSSNGSPNPPPRA